MSRRAREKEREEKLRILIADDSRDAIEQASAWIRERWPEAELLVASLPEEAIIQAIDHQVENLLLDLDFGAQRASGVVIARKVLESRSKNRQLKTRVLFRTVHAGDPGYLHQVEKLIADEKQKPDVWGFLDKGAVPKRIVQNAVEQVFVYELSFTDFFARQLKDSPSREFSNLEFTVLIYLCLGATNDGVGWLIGASRQSVERIVGALYRKLRVSGRADAPKGVPALLESRTRLCYEAVTRGLINPHLLREEDGALRERVRKSGPSFNRLFIDPYWLDREGRFRNSKQEE
jgi:DNA-binding NarL/FixJ family response regulator